MKNLFRNAVLISLLLVTAPAALAQPTMSRGQQILSISYDECLSRAQGAFSAESWVNIGTSGNAVAAFKGVNGAYIVCNPADGKMAVNIFVASSANDSGVPGAERVKLQGRMDGTAPPPAGNSLVRTQKPVYGSNEPVVVEYSGFPGSATDWFAIAKAGASDESYVTWAYTEGKRSGTHTFGTLSLGEYEVRAYFNWSAGGYNVQGRYRFSVR